MVFVAYRGRFGNNLFQYALGRYLAEEKGYELVAQPLPFEATFQKVSGSCYPLPRCDMGTYHIDVPAVIADKTNRAIVIHGYFQHFSYYAPFMDRIRRWFSYPRDRFALPGIDPEDLLIYIRLSDYCSHGWALQFAFYEAAIKMAQPRKIYIATEEVGHPFIRQFDSYEPVIISRDPFSDFAMAHSFRKVAISCSTFSWWAVLLGDVEEIYVPIAESGLWSPQTMQLPNYDQDLRIDDSRYTYIYNAPNIMSPRSYIGHVPLSEAKPTQMHLHRFAQKSTNFHKLSKAFWLL